MARDRRLPQPAPRRDDPDTVEQLRDEVEQLREERTTQQDENARLRRDRERLRDELKRLTEALEAARRAGKRQAAPFSKGAPKAQPKKPGRKSGRAYGRRSTRPRPPHIDDRIHVPLPEACPHCAGALQATHTAEQVQGRCPDRAADGAGL